MTLVTIDLGDVAGGHDPDDHVVIRAEAFRESQGGGITSTAEVKIPLVDGVGQAEVDPGPVVIAFRCRAVADTREKRGVVPDTGPVGIEDVLSESMVYTAPVVSRALATINSAVGAAVAGEMGQAVRQATTSAVSAEQAAVRADVRATSAETKVDAYTPRVEALEVMGSLAPGEPVDGQTANLVSQSSTLTRKAVTDTIGESTGHYPISYFGAVGDGVADDTVAVDAALRSGLPLYWGDDGTIYRVTSRLMVTVSKAVVWSSAGAMIECDAPTPIQHVLMIHLNGNPMVSTGPLTVNAARKAFTGLSVHNNSDTPVNLMLDQVRVKNAYRSSKTFTGGDGFQVRGNFTTITMRRPIVENVTMAVGAGIPGSQGITGITIQDYSSTRTPRDIEIEAPYIDGVFDEDFSSGLDQDGIRIFGTSETRFRISGGTTRNCGGRAVKAQVEWGIVDGLTIIREQARARGGREVDFQLGGGQVSNLRCIYKDNVPLAVVEFSGAAEGNANIPNGSLSGLKVLTTGSQRINQVVGVGTRSPDSSYNVLINNVELSGTQPEYLLGARGQQSSQTDRVTISDVYVSPAISLIASGFAASPEWNSEFILSNVINPGLSVPLWIKNSSQNKTPKVHSSNVMGFSLVPVPVGMVATVKTTSETPVSGWNQMVIESGFGRLAADLRTYYYPPPGRYRITYRRDSGVTFERALTNQRDMITLVNGIYREEASFDGSGFFRIVGSMSDITVTFEAISY